MQLDLTKGFKVFETSEIVQKFKAWKALVVLLPPLVAAGLEGAAMENVRQSAAIEDDILGSSEIGHAAAAVKLQIALFYARQEYPEKGDCRNWDMAESALAALGLTRAGVIGNGLTAGVIAA